MAGLVILLRPYKKNAHNIIDFLILFFMMLIAIMSFISNDISAVVGYFVIYLPTLVLMFYLFYKLMRLCVTCCKCKRFYQRLTPEQPPNAEQLENSAQHDSNSLIQVATHSILVISDYVPDDMFADRLLNPAGYKKESRTRYQAINN